MNKRLGMMLLASLALSSTAGAVKWEYARLFSDSGKKYLQLPGRNLEGDYDLLFKKLNCTVTLGHFTDLLNCLGKDGWELAGSGGVFGSTDYLFKRVAK